MWCYGDLLFKKSGEWFPRNSFFQSNQFCPHQTRAVPPAVYWIETATLQLKGSQGHWGWLNAACWHFKRCLGKYPFLNTTGFPLMKYELVSLWLWTNNFDFRGNLVRALLAFNYSFNIQLPSPNPQFHCQQHFTHKLIT